MLEVAQLSLDELATLITDAKLPNISCPVTRPPRFVILSPGGTRQEVVSEEEGYTKLGKLLTRAVGLVREELGAEEVVKGTEK